MPQARREAWAGAIVNAASISERTAEEDSRDTFGH
jgi:hypothetical protein